MKNRRRCPAVCKAAGALLACVVLALSACTAISPPVDAQDTPSAEASVSTTVSAPVARGYYVVGKNGRYGVVDGRGQTILPVEFAEVIILHDGVTPVLIYAVNGEAHAGGEEAYLKPLGWLYAMDGTSLIQGEYYYPMILGSGLIGVWDSSGMGVITQEGEQVVPCAYEDVSLCGGSIVANKYGSENAWAIDIYDTDGSLQSSGTVEGYLYTTETLWGGYIVIENKETGKYGLLDLTLSEVFPPIWDYIQPAGEGTFIANRNGRYGVVDAQGDEVLPFEYNFIQVDTDAYGKGKTVFPAASPGGVCIFDPQWKQTFFAEGYISVWVYDGAIIANDEAGYSYLLGADGSQIAPAAVEMYWDADVQLVIVQESYDSAQSYYTREGVQVQLPVCDYSMPVNPDRFIIIREQPDGTSLYGMCDAKGNMILPMQYSSLSADGADLEGLYTANGKYLTFTEKNEFDTEYSGVMDVDGNVLLPAVYDYVHPDGDLLRVRVGPAYGLMDIAGNWVWQASDYDALMD